MKPDASTEKADCLTWSAKVEVWDIAVRLFHWSLVLLVATTAITGFLAAEWWLDYHVWAGYGIALLLMFRLAWGFVGSYYARFASFRFPFRVLLKHMREVVSGKGGQYLGHNPAGALMVFALIFVLLALVLSGLIGLGGQENQGMLAAFADYQSGVLALEIHDILSILLLGMIVAHLAGVVLESVLSKENLVRAMVTGRKKAEPGRLPHSFGKKRVVWRAPVVVALIGLIVGPAYWQLTNMPASGFVAMKNNPTWASECGDCHYAYHPSLLPRSSWDTVMSGLSDHFGEDASLDKDTQSEISAFLSKYSSEHWDSEAANELQKVDLKKPLEITASPYWKQRHEEIEPLVFKRKSIGSKGNCIACHTDAKSGHFADEKISIPE